MVGPSVKLSFDILLKLHEVMQFNKLVTMFSNAGTDIPKSEEQAGFHYGTARTAVLGGGQQ